MGETRKLAAIMFTDIVGYSAMMSKDEKQAMDVLEKNRKIHLAAIERYNGQYIKEIGDGTLSVFQSSLDAVSGAIEIQKTCCAKHDFQVRIGINIGDVIFKDNDVFGEGVNIASRIEAAGKTGGVYISGRVYEDVKNKKDIHAMFIEEKRLKNIDHPVNIYSVVTGSEREIIAESKPKGLVLPKEKSIIVLPFENMSPDPEQEYFSDGLTEEIITDLAQIKKLNVVSRSSAMTFKGSKMKIKEIAKETNVHYVLEGSVRKAGNKLRIVAQLIHAASDSHLWAEKYTGTLDDIFDIQEKVSMSIVNSLKLKILDKELQNITRRYTNNTDAFNAYLKGRYFWNRRTKEDCLKSLESFELAIKHDSSFVLAYTGLADLYAVLGWYGLMSMDEANQKAKETALKGLAIDDSVSEIHVTLGNIMAWFEFKFKDAGPVFRKAIELNPDNSEARHMYAHYLGAIGKIEESIHEMRLAFEMEPLSINFSSCMGIMLFIGRYYDEAIEQLKKTIELNAEFNQAYYWLGRAYLAKGDIDPALKTLQKAASFPETKSMSEATTAYILAIQGDTEKARNIIGDIEKLSDKEYIDVFFLALAYAGLGDCDAAIKYLEKGYENYSMYIYYLTTDPILDPLHSDERFIKLARKMELIQ